MDDTDRNQGQTQGQQPQSGGVGALVKEQEPVNSALQTESNLSEFVKPSGVETEPKIHEELEKIGVKSVSETPQLDDEAQKAGISHAGESVPLKTESLPTDEEIQKILKTTDNTDSKHWWAKIVEKVKKHINLMQQSLLTRRN